MNYFYYSWVDEFIFNPSGYSFAQESSARNS